MINKKSQSSKSYKKHVHKIEEVFRYRCYIISIYEPIVWRMLCSFWTFCNCLFPDYTIAINSGFDICQRKNFLPIIWVVLGFQSITDTYHIYTNPKTYTNIYWNYNYNIQIEEIPRFVSRKFPDLYQAYRKGLDLIDSKITQCLFSAVEFPTIRDVF